MRLFEERALLIQEGLETSISIKMGTNRQLSNSYSLLVL